MLIKPIVLWRSRKRRRPNLVAIHFLFTFISLAIFLTLLIAVLLLILLPGAMFLKAASVPVTLNKNQFSL